MATKLKAGTSTSGGVFEPDTAGTLELQTGSTPTTAVTIDASQNVGIGTSSPSQKLSVKDATSSPTVSASFSSNNNGVYVRNSGSTTSYVGDSTGANNSIAFDTTGYVAVLTNNGAERMRIDSSGTLRVGATSDGLWVGTEKLAVSGFSQFKHTDSPALIWNTTVSGTRSLISFSINTTRLDIGSITSNGSSTAYNTSSDYRLKENIAPMTGALDRVSALKPVTYNWKADGSSGEGFIAHELQAIVPDCVIGEKDAVNEDGSIKPQGIDTSFLVATLTAAIQEQQAMIEQLTTRLNALEGK